MHEHAVFGAQMSRYGSAHVRSLRNSHSLHLMQNSVDAELHYLRTENARLQTVLRQLGYEANAGNRQQRGGSAADVDTASAAIDDARSSSSSTSTAAAPSCNCWLPTPTTPASVGTLPVFPKMEDVTSYC